MTLQHVSLLFIAVGMLLFIIIICTQGLSCIKYLVYRGHTQAVITEIEDFSVAKSRGIVEKQDSDGTFTAVPATQDKNAPYFDLSFHSMAKTQAILSWTAENNKWRARYPYLRNKGGFKLGTKINLHYSLKSPWKYALYDKQLWYTFSVKCVCCISIFLIGMLLLTK